MRFKEIILGCYGDSTVASTWSNIPYLLSIELENRGVQLHRLNLLPNKYLNFIYERIKPMLFWQSKEYDIIRTPFHRWIVKRRINRIIKHHPSCDGMMLLCFDFYFPKLKINQILLSDWTYKYYIESIKHSLPGKADKKFYDRQKYAIENCNLSITLFPTLAEYLKHEYPRADIWCNRTNVINDMCHRDLSRDDIIKAKLKSRSFVMVGNYRYLSQAKRLIEVFDSLNSDGVEAHLHLIGLKPSDIGTDASYIHCHGYLRKDVLSENNKYYEILSESRGLLTLVDNWGGYSSGIESMYYYCPIISLPSPQFVNEFGRDNEAFSFVEDSKQVIYNAIKENLELAEQCFLEKCYSAHNNVEDYTWSKYVNNLLHRISQI